MAASAPFYQHPRIQALTSTPSAGRVVVSPTKSWSRCQQLCRVKSIVRHDRTGIMRAKLYGNDDDDEREGGSKNLVLDTLSAVPGVAATVVQKATDIVHPLVQDKVERSTVQLGLSIGLGIALLAVVRSVLSFALFVGALVLGWWVYQNFFAVESVGDDSLGGGSDGSGGARSSRGPPRPRSSGSPSQWGGNKDVVDVWRGSRQFGRRPPRQ